MRIRLYWLLIFLLISAGAFYFYQDAQPHLSYQFLDQFDGNDYQKIYDYFEGTSSEYTVSFPFNSRILVPWLASLVGTGDIIQNFTYINLFFTLLSVVILFLLWRDLGFEFKWFAFGFGWLLFHWTGMVRLNAFDPITVDLPLYCFQALLLWLVIKRKFVWLLLLGPVATLQKESFIGLLLILTLYAWFHNRKEQDAFFNLQLILSALLISVLTKFIIGSIFNPIEEGRNSIITILYHMRELAYHPFRLIRWTTAFFVAFGPMLIAFLFSFRVRGTYDNRRNIMLVFSILYALFGIFAGGDMTRIIFLGFPFIMTLIIYQLHGIENRGFWILSLLSIPLIFLTRQIPDPAFQWDAWTNWYPEFASRKAVLLMAGYGLISILVMRLFKVKPN